MCCSFLRRTASQVTPTWLRESCLASFASHLHIVYVSYMIYLSSACTSHLRLFVICVYLSSAITSHLHLLLICIACSCTITGPSHSRSASRSLPMQGDSYWYFLKPLLKPFLNPLMRSTVAFEEHEVQIKHNVPSLNLLNNTGITMLGRSRRIACILSNFDARLVNCNTIAYSPTAA